MFMEPGNRFKMRDGLVTMLAGNLEVDRSLFLPVLAFKCRLLHAVRLSRVGLWPTDRGESGRGPQSERPRPQSDQLTRASMRALPDQRAKLLPTTNQVSRNASFTAWPGGIVRRASAAQGTSVSPIARADGRGTREMKPAGHQDGRCAGVVRPVAAQVSSVWRERSSIAMRAGDSPCPISQAPACRGFGRRIRPGLAAEQMIVSTGRCRARSRRAQ